MIQALALLLAVAALEPCHGHTIVVWDEYTEPAAYFEVERSIAGANVWTVVGNTAYKNRPAYTDEEGTFHPALRPERWDVLRASPMPVQGVIYEYRIRAVGANGTRSAPSNTVFRGPQDPTTCYGNGRVEACQ